MAIKKNAPVTINVSLDENKIPEKIKWSAPDGGVEDQEAKAMFLTFWDGKKRIFKNGSMDKRNASRRYEIIFSSKLIKYDQVF